MQQVDLLRRMEMVFHETKWMVSFGNFLASSVPVDKVAKIQEVSKLFLGFL